MNYTLITSILTTMVSLGFLITSLVFLFRIFKVLYGPVYKGLWWTTFLLISVLILSGITLLLELLSGSEISNSIFVITGYLSSAIFAMIVMHTGYLSTSQLKNTSLSRRYLDKIVQTLKSFLVVTDADFNIKLVNEEVLSLLAKSKEELTGKQVNSIFQDLKIDQNQTAEGNLKSTINAFNGKQIEVLISVGKILKKNGNVDGYVFQGCENYQKQINEMYTFYRSILNSSDFAILATDKHGIITMVNPAVENYFGYKSEELKHKLFMHEMHDMDDLDQHIDNNYVYMDNGLGILHDEINSGNVLAREMQMVRKNGEKFPALVTINSIMSNNEIVGYCEIIVDISEKKKAEEELTKINEELKDFAHIVSHDLKAPLRAIGTLASWLEDDYSEQLGEEGQQQFELLRSRVSRMEGLINGILEYSRVGMIKEKAAKLDLNDILEDVKDSIVPTDRFEVNVANPLPAIQIDKTRIHQIFQNIISNSVKYMDKEYGKIDVRCEKENGYWKFSVADNGPGIEKQYFDKIFQIFQTLKPRDEYESTGVGLAVVKKSVEMYGGKVWLDSEPLKGTTFFFTLPEN